MWPGASKLQIEFGGTKDRCEELQQNAQMLRRMAQRELAAHTELLRRTFCCADTERLLGKEEKLAKALETEADALFTIAEEIAQSKSLLQRIEEAGVYEFR